MSDACSNGLPATRLFATICNTIAEASPYALWYSDGVRQFVVDLADHMQASSGLTGIEFHEGRLYLAVQSGTPRILVLDDTLAVIETITHDAFADLHSIHVFGNSLFIISSGNGLLLQRDLTTGRIEAIVRFDPRAWVCAMYRKDDDILLCAHHMQHLNPASQGGGIFSVLRRKAVLAGLGNPHSMIGFRDGYIVLDSLNGRVVYFDDSAAPRTVVLDGFVRGAAVHEDSLLVASGPHRTVSRKNPTRGGDRVLREVTTERVKLFELDDSGQALVYLPEMPGFEVYDLMTVPAHFGPRPDAGRVIEVHPGTFARLYYTALIAARSG